MNPTVEPRSVGIATDKELEEMVRSFSLDQVYRDDDAEEARRLQKKQQEALLQEQRNAAAKEADRRARTKSFPDRTFDVLGIRIGMTKDGARAALLASDSTYAIRDNDPSISFYSQSKCDFPWRELIKKLPKRAGDAAAERLLSGDKPGGTPTTNATIPEELLSELPPECRKSDLAWIEVGFTGSRKLADGTTDRVTVYMPGNGRPDLGWQAAIPGPLCSRSAREVRNRVV